MRRAAALAAAATLAVLLAACGGSDKKDSSSATTVAPGNYTGDANSKFCQLGAQLNQRLSGLSSALSTSVADAKASVTQVKDLVDQAKADTPSQVKGDVDTLASAFEKFVGDVDSASGLPEVSAALAKFGNSVQVAAQHLQTYGEKVCGISTSGSTP